MKFAQTPEEITSITDQALAAADALVESIVSSEERTWDTTMAPLDAISDLIGRSFGSGAFMGYVHTDEAVRKVARQEEERMSQWSVELVFRDDLYRAVSDYAATEEAAQLEGERKRLLEFTQRDLRKAGHELDPETRAEVKKLTQRLVELSVAFETNIAEYEDSLEVTKADLAGLPDSYIEGLASGAAEDTFKVTMAYPDVVPFMDNAERRDLREQLAYKFNNRAVDENRDILAEAVAVRSQIAHLFGQPSWAHHRLEEKMAVEPGVVEAFYDSLIPPLTKAGTEEIETMRQMLAADVGDPDATLQPWDWRFYHTKLRREQHGVDPNAVAEYFPLESVLDGLFTITGDVFGLDYEPADIESWHSDVRSFAVKDRADGRFIANFHMDLFPREGKFSHAAAFPLVPGRRRDDGTYQTPVSAIVANFTKPSGERPSLLKHDEVETLFHEFGHILHQVLTTAEIVRFSGSSTEGDFVEAPSQIMEHWTWRPEVLSTFARHYQTGEPIPTELVAAMVAARNLNIAIQTLRQAQFGVLDMALHGTEAAGADLDEVHRMATRVGLLPLHEGTFFPASFGHLLAGYDAGYYGYLWSEVYGDDMFSRFDQEGVTNPAVGADYRREILEAGGTKDGMDLLTGFLGREPSNEAFLRKLGLGD